MTETVPPRHTRWKLYVPLGIAGALLLAYTVLWFQGARTMRAEISAWTAREAAEGRIARHGEVGVRGYPGSLRAVIDEPVWLDPDGGRAWRAETLLVIAQPVSPRTLLLVPRGAQEVVIGERTYGLRADDLRVSLGETQVAMQAENLTMEGEAETLTLGLGRANWAATDEGEALLFELRDAVATDAGGPLDIAVLRGAMSAAPGRDLTLDGFDAALRTGDETRPLRVAGEGALALDRTGALDGRLTVTVTDPQPLLALLGARGLVAPEQAGLAASVAPMFAGEDGAVTVPLTFRGGAMSAAGFPLATIPPLGG